MKKKNIIAALMLALCGTTGTWAQGELTPNGDKTVWTLAAMPAYDIELQAEYYTDLSDADAIDYSSIQNTTADLWIERTLATDSYNTFALPFDMTLDAFKAKIGDNGVAVKELTNASLVGGTLTLNFGDATSIEAGVPYLVKLSGSESVTLGAFDEVAMPATVEGKTVSKEGVAFVGTVGKTTLTGTKENILFLAAGNALKHPSSEGQNLKGFRAYFQLTGEAANSITSYAIDFGGETTGVKEIVGVKAQSAGSADAYNLGGQRVGDGYKGIVIVNGKKMIK